MSITDILKQFSAVFGGSKIDPEAAAKQYDEFVKSNNAERDAWIERSRRELRAALSSRQLTITPEQQALLAEWVEHWDAMHRDLAPSQGRATRQKAYLKEFLKAHAAAHRAGAASRSDYVWDFEEPEPSQLEWFMSTNIPNPDHDEGTFDRAWHQHILAGYRDWQALGAHDQWWIAEHDDNPFDHVKRRLIPDAPVPHADLLAGRYGRTETLFDLLGKATSAKPSVKWAKAVAELCESEHGPMVREAVMRWLETLAISGKPADRVRLWRLADTYIEFARTVLELVDAYGGPRPAALRWMCGQSHTMIYADGSGNFGGRASDPAVLSTRATEIVRGAVFTLANWRDDEAVGCIARTAERMLVRLCRERGALTYRSLAAANACVLALSEIATPAAVMALERIKRATRDRAIANQVEKAKALAAGNAGLSVSELEELSVPTGDLSAVGEDVVAFGDVSARLSIEPGKGACLAWIAADGRPLKSAPASVTKDSASAAELKALKARVKAIDEVLGIQRNRIEALYLTDRTWPLATWRERYLDHPLVGALARRLIWRLVDNDQRTDVIWRDGTLVDVEGHSLSPSEATRVSLWHPLDGDVAAVTAWRRFLIQHRIVQPFKQAHRETYPLTDAERATATYSNRFAGHVLRQHQSAALARMRGWQARLQLGYDGGTDDPWWRLHLPALDLTAEFCVNGIDQQLAPQGSFVFITTDRVRFVPGAPKPRYNEAVDARPLADVPARYLSEVLRDVDLMVGVASVGNDPTWADQGPDRHRTYWHQHATGELGISGEARRDIIAELLPSLKIGPACRLADRYLHVTGKRHEYRIHLGSGNILMEDGRYLCIVPGSERGPSSMFIPFEGDRMLALILSKAVLLAADHKITDPTILSQL